MIVEYGESFSLLFQGSHLGPGTYAHNYKSGTDQLLSKVVSTKGPYNLFSGERSDGIAAGYFATPVIISLHYKFSYYGVYVVSFLHKYLETNLRKNVYINLREEANEA